MTNRPDTPITTGQDAARVALAELRAQLAERERMLTALTEQSLRVLDDLAEARRNPPERPETAARLTSLETLLRDARQRLRLGTRAVLAPAARRSTDVDFEVVLWDVPAHPHGELERAGRVFGSIPVDVLAGPDHRIEDFQVEHETWSVFETPCRRPAHFWNEAMALVEEGTEVVVFAASGVELDQAGLAQLAAAARLDGVAVAVPVLLVGEQHYLGRTEHALMDVRPTPTNPETVPTTIPFASPEVFAISRAAFERVGPFDQDLAGDLALAEWTARAAPHSMRCIGVAESVARVDALRSATSDVLEQADRLVFLARHRPAQVVHAALAGDAMWQGDPGVVAATLRAAFLRLPRASEMPAAVDLLVQQAATLADWKRLAPSVRERVSALCRELQLTAEGVRTDSALLPAVERAQERVVALRARVAAAEGLQERIRQLEETLARNSAGAVQTERQLKDEMIARSNTIDALRNELLERERAIASLRQDLGHRQGEVQRFVDHLAQQQQEIQRLQDVKAKSAVEIERLRAGETEVVRLQAELARAAEAAERSRAQFADAERLAAEAAAAERQQAAAALAEATQAAAAAMRELAEERERTAAALKRLEHAEIRVADATEQLASLEAARVLGESAASARAEEVQRLERELASLREQGERVAATIETANAATAEQRALAASATAAVAARDERIRALEAMVGTMQATGDELARKVQVLTDTIATLERKGHEQRRGTEIAQRERDELRRTLDALREERAQVAAQKSEVEQRLSEREQWILTLLAEVQQRRVAGRSLQPHEAEFVARLRGASRR